MSVDSLSLSEAKALLAHVDMGKNSWLTFKDKKDLLTAIDHDADEVYLRGPNTIFDISYKTSRSVNYVFIKAVRSFTPCGSFDIKRMRQEVKNDNVIAGL